MVDVQLSHVSKKNNNYTIKNKIRGKSIEYSS